MSENNEYVYGIHPVEEALKNPETGIDKLFIRQQLKHSKASVLRELASARRIPVVDVPGKKLFEMVGKVNDQGVVAQISGISYTELEDWIAQTDIAQKPVVLVLSEIEDTHNFGAILRSAAAAEASAVIVPKHRQAPVNATVFKTSAGTAGMVPVIRVTNINQTIEQLKEAGFWLAALEGNADKTIWEEDFNAPMGIVVGSEGSGIRHKTAELCDFRLSIPISPKVESLNASVSTAIVLFEICRKRSMSKG